MQVNVRRRKERRENVYSRKEMKEVSQMKQKSHRGNESGLMQKRVPWFSAFACFGIMPSAINGQCRETLSFGMFVLVQSTRPVGLQGQVGKIQNLCFYWQRVSELSENFLKVQNSACFLTYAKLLNLGFKLYCHEHFLKNQIALHFFFLAAFKVHLVEQG